MKQHRREFIKVVVAGLTLAGLPLAAHSQGAGKMKIGIVGSGRVGSALGGVWVKKGHGVMFSSRNIEHD
jgi:hypothetical protein